jgi:hypothetical protein
MMRFPKIESGPKKRGEIKVMFRDKLNNSKAISIQADSPDRMMNPGVMNEDD